MSPVCGGNLPRNLGDLERLSHRAISGAKAKSHLWASGVHGT